MLSQSLVMFVSLMDVQESYKCTPTHSIRRGGTVCVLLVQAFRTVRVELYASSLAVQWMEQVQHLGIHRKFNELIILILLYEAKFERVALGTCTRYTAVLCVCVHVCHRTIASTDLISGFSWHFLRYALWILLRMLCLKFWQHLLMPFLLLDELLMDK